jgi:hypothetical protein
MRSKMEALVRGGEEGSRYSAGDAAAVLGGGEEGGGNDT